ncbi:putative disease resistance protein RGA1 [Rosa chinensis]|uniref:putative disease resistance protein RGA1 n=1 Tax=Rosa chinensis TaxID=74649 RepID=UPI000D08E1E0|nr:putative disease resistance protein RGA1 [Rosa chinensis]
MEKVEKVGVEFLGIEEETETLSGILFPRLERLSFESMYNWEGITKEDSSSDITIMPLLYILEIYECPELIALPNFLYKITTLRTLTIERCPILEQDYEKGVGKEWHNISHIPNITIRPESESEPEPETESKSKSESE